ncbi:MAG TPA: hypothetical protein VFE58_14870 [Tepidisphaeraceae bacterium]|nr:hypothetical protein [Tepidisphaeraceae bacterium]
MRLLLAIIFVSVLTTAVIADKPATTQDEIGSLIAKLSSDDYQTREDATQDLIRLGEAALPRLQKVLPQTEDAETRNRIQSAVDQISESSVAGESLITLNVTEEDAKTVFAEIGRQAHAEINLSADVLGGLPKVTFRCDHESFWKALHRLCSPLGLQPDFLLMSNTPFVRRNMNMEHAINLVKSATGAWDKIPVSYSGPYMICVQQITETGVVIPATNQRAHNLIVQCMVYAEPKLTVVGRSPTARVIEPDPGLNPAGIGGVGFGGMMNLRPGFASRMYYNPTAASMWSVMVPLSRPNGAVEKLARLKAITNVKVLVRSETWDLANIEKVTPRSWNAGGRTFSLKSVSRQGGDTIEVAASVSRHPDRPMEDVDIASAFNSLELLDSQGRSLPVRARSGRGGEDPGVLSYVILFEATPEGAPVQGVASPLRLRWRLPVETKDSEVGFEFGDLPLP